MDEIAAMASEKLVKRIARMVDPSEYKRRQASRIKITPRG
jgi:hypothetical protein